MLNLAIYTIENDDSIEKCQKHFVCVIEEKVINTLE